MRVDGLIKKGGAHIHDELIAYETVGTMLTVDGPKVWWHLEPALNCLHCMCTYSTVASHSTRLHAAQPSVSFSLAILSANFGPVSVLGDVDGSSGGAVNPSCSASTS